MRSTPPCSRRTATSARRGPCTASWSTPRKSASGATSCATPATTDLSSWPPGQPGLLLGHHQAQGSDQVDLLPPLRDARPVQPLRGGLDAGLRGIVPGGRVRPRPGDALSLLGDDGGRLHGRGLVRWRPRAGGRVPLPLRPPRLGIAHLRRDRPARPDGRRGDGSDAPEGGLLAPACRRRHQRRDPAAPRLAHRRLPRELGHGQRLPGGLHHEDGRLRPRTSLRGDGDPRLGGRRDGPLRRRLRRPRERHSAAQDMQGTTGRSCFSTQGPPQSVQVWRPRGPPSSLPKALRPFSRIS